MSFNSLASSSVSQTTRTPRVIALFGVRYIAAAPTNSKYLLTVIQQSLLLLRFTDNTHTESYIALFGVRRHAHRELYSTVWCQSLLLLRFADDTPDDTHTESYIALFGVSLASSSVSQTTHTLRVMTLFGVRTRLIDTPSTSLYQHPPFVNFIRQGLPRR
ncbi:uncharacterized protein F5147DRAFT_775388 [Suillus discolor]|uniref:Uncharacterized protein n=1 Tax=Suillus discolor TaxID=1912936 RepID=A0A9P7JSG1_9AGAM|nr:uncharacterized protein F5147DRAFT_775388 [Suillus discolor]KAG2105065.1 hypothetical protein F5147DRAFT_775388 [Suillus discolor]